MINIEDLLPLVSKPSRYIDHEINAVRKSFAEHRVRMLFAFPDVYELGISHLGLKILYSIVNRLPYAMADRVYLPWLDLLELLKRDNLPLFGLESRVAAPEFDLLGITLQSELTFSNVLEMIASCHIPVFSAERSSEDPIVMVGGPCATNPLPLAPFIDVFFFGEAEEGIVEIAQIMRDIPDRSDRLAALACLDSVWVPVHTSPDSPWEIQIPTQSIRSRKYSGFHTSENLHSPQLLSWQLATHNRYVAEIMRGCSRGCRFCHAGYFYRPVRERDPKDILRELLAEVKSSGWDEAGLVSLSSSDYTCIRELLFSLLSQMNTDKTHISLPSLRVDSLDDSLVSLMQSLGREGLTIAPEAGSQRLRDVINKNLSEEEILRGVELAMSLGWQKIKLYFMIGLPTETDADIQAIIDLVQRINLLTKKRMQISITLSPFTPKPFTPFQWAEMLAPQLLLERAQKIKSSLFKARNIRAKYHTIENSVLEACITRGDIGMAKVIYTAWQNGARFDAWRENWDYSRWETAFEQAGTQVSHYLSAFDLGEPLPWDFVDIGVCKAFLLQEYQKSLKGETTADCREICTLCGACDDKAQTVNAPGAELLITDSESHSQAKQYNPQVQFRYRIGYQKTGLLRFISHLDWMRMLFRRISVLQLPTVFTMGFSPHPKVSLSPPLPVGVESLCEYFDISFYEKLSPQTILQEFRQTKIPDFEITACEAVSKGVPRPNREKLLFELPEELLSQAAQRIEDFAKAEEFSYLKQTEKRRKLYDLKQIVIFLQLEGRLLFIEKKLESPSLYDLLSAILDLDKESLYRCRALRKEFGF
ncbi:MAG: TIGR03960 family B12-binding radical SAM protein [Candidatus Cloacimonadaceae bacterium]|jgi:radical SAM family uncharacterized protein/radical SAM-linked protein|nr:TIGR03960 family B12-binding radical SAM protein [Candidatus Cloacimonadota bacterium]